MQRAQMLGPGITALGLSSLWLLISTTMTLDQQERRAEEAAAFSLDPSLSARQVTFRFILPSALLITGVVLTTSGAMARRRVERARDAFYLRPQISRGGGGLSAGGRF